MQALQASVVAWWNKHWKALLAEAGLLALASLLGTIATIISGSNVPTWVNVAFVEGIIQAAQAKVAKQAQIEATALQGAANSVKPTL